MSETGFYLGYILDLCFILSSIIILYFVLLKQVAETSGQFDGEVYFRDEPAFPESSSTCTSDFISTGFTTSPDYLMLHNDIMATKTSESTGLDSMSILPTKMCTACKATVSSTWRYGPKGPRVNHSEPSC